MKRNIVFLLMLLSIPSLWAYHVEVDGIYYNLYSTDQTANVVYNSDVYDPYAPEGSSTNPYSGDVVIPEHITAEGKTYAVTAIGNSCFKGCSGLRSVIIPKSVTSLEDSCFEGCNSLTSISLPTSITSLGINCFFGCRGLTSLTLPSSLTSMGRACLAHCTGLPSISIPESVTSIDASCFQSCSNLTSISLPKALTTLGSGCFWECKRLGSITIPESVTTIDDGCFSQCVSLTSIFMLPPTPPTTGSKVFLSVPLQTVYVVDENAKARYQAASPWNQYRIVVMPTGIDNVQKDAPRITHLYDLSGKPLNGHQHGPVIVRYNDGSTHKLLLK